LSPPSSTELARLTPAEQQARKVVVCVNPRAGARSSLAVTKKLQTVLQNENLEPVVISAADEIGPTVRDLVANQDLRAVVAAGGDGTIAFVANRVPPETPLCVLPLGTENLLAKYLRIKNRPEVILTLLQDGFVRRYDAAQAGERIFLLMLSCGFDAEVVRRVAERRRGNISHLSYARPIWESVFQFSYPTMKVTLLDEQGEPLPGPDSKFDCRWLFALNMPRYAMGLPIAPNATGDDGQLDICAFGNGSFFSTLRYFSAVLRRRQEFLADCRTARCAGIRIESEQPIPVQTDGDFADYSPLDVRILPRRIRLIVPKAFAVAS
jgi:diacylglycerol kinase (ATP)